MMEFLRRWLRGHDKPAIEPVEETVCQPEDVKCVVVEHQDRRKDHQRREAFDREDKQKFKQDKVDTEGRVAHVLRSRDQYKRGF